MSPTTETFACDCCGGEPGGGCCDCGSCCFSHDSEVVLTWSIAGRNVASTCHCPEAATEGSYVLAYESCDDGVARWSASTCETPYPCGVSDSWLRLRVWRQCAGGQWNASVDALVGDELGNPCEGVLACGLLLVASGGGNCCGITDAETPFSFGCCHFEGAVTVTWSVVVQNNGCCKDDGACAEGEANCDGTCQEEPLP